MTEECDIDDASNHKGRPPVHICDTIFNLFYLFIT